MNNNNFPVILLACGAILLAVICTMCIAGLVSYLLLAGTAQVPEPEIEVTPQFSPPSRRTATPRPTRESGSPAETLPADPDATLAPTAVFDSSQVNDAALETLKTFNEEIVPINDPIDLAQRLKNRTGLARQLEFPVKIYAVGDREIFWVTNSDTNQSRQVEATLQYVTEHVYFWIMNGTRFNTADLERLVETFENEIYPRNREFFGSEWTPGVDADPHLYILYADGLGSGIAGYFSSSDEYLPMVREKSNGHEMFLINTSQPLDAEYTYGVLAHEFQHMIHWYRDRNEDTWMNEGFGDVAMFLNNYDIGGADQSYVADPDIQLNDWPTTPENRTAHYGGSFLFLTYFLDRFGEQATKNLVADEANGMVSIDQVLAGLGVADDETGSPVGADDLFADWAIASYLQDGSVADGRYTYHNYSQAPNPDLTETIEDCPLQPTEREVSQYGVDYISIRCNGNYTLRFEGSHAVGALPTDPYSGDYVYYSNRGDESDMTLTRSFDFTGVSGPLTLKYWTWYDLEEDYDYLHLVASEDGTNWKMLTTPSGTSDNPVGNSYGWAYNGVSGRGRGPEWIEEEVDISQYAGKQVQLRFEYITDAAVNGEGFLLDDVAVPEIDYFTDFESDDGGWQGDGFVRIQNTLPQTFRLSLIRLGDETQVEKVPVPANGVVEIPIVIDRSVREIVLVVSGTSRFTRQDARYRFGFTPR